VISIGIRRREVEARRGGSARNREPGSRIPSFPWTIATLAAATKENDGLIQFRPIAGNTTDRSAQLTTGAIRQLRPGKRH